MPSLATTFLPPLRICLSYVLYAYSEGIHPAIPSRSEDGGYSSPYKTS